MSKTLLWLVILVVIIGGAVYYLNQRSRVNPAPTPQTAIQVSPTTVSSPSPSETGAIAKGAAVTVTANGFEPATVTIKAGETVTWTNKSGTAVNIKSAVHPTHLVYPPLNLGQVQNGASMSLKFDKAGSYKYHNHLEPSQIGTVIVQ